MNKQVLKFGFGRAALVALFAGVLSFSSMAAVNETLKDAKASPSAVQYVGTSNDGIVFNVKHENADAAKFDLIIKNEYGDIVYQQQYNDKNFDKRVVLVKEGGDARLTFIIRSGNTSYKQVFNITTTTKTVEDVVVENAK